MATIQRVLHVDDEPDIREIAKLALESIGGYVVESCGSGREALEKAPGFAPDIILLDVMMPGMDGPTTFQEFRRIPDLANTPVIFMTAKVQSREIDEYLDLGAAGVITKPFDPVTLCGEIEGLWNAFKG